MATPVNTSAFVGTNRENAANFRFGRHPGRTQEIPTQQLFFWRSAGRVIRALYDDPNLLTLSGKTIIAAEAAERYGISDLDGYERPTVLS